MGDNKSLLKFDENGEIVIGCVKHATEVIIPIGVKYIAGYHFFDGGAFEGCEDLISIQIPNTVTEIGNYAFYGCKSLKSIKIPNSTTCIGAHAFFGCTALTSIEIPNKVEHISDFDGCTSLISIEIPNSVKVLGSFINCKSLTSIEIPNSVKFLGSFEGCESLTNIDIPNSVKTIGGFLGCKSLKSITLSDNLGWIGNDCFSGCTSLASIVIPKGVISIGEQAFCQCTALTYLYIPSSVRYIEPKAFIYCNHLQQFIVDEGNTYFKSIDGVLYDIEEERLICYPPGRKSDFFEIPEGIKRIDSGGTFSGGISSIIIPKSVTYIGEDEFDCSDMKELHLRHEHPEELTIHENAFCSPENCTLFVPIGTGYAYRHDSRFDGFKEIKIDRIYL